MVTLVNVFLRKGTLLSFLNITDITLIPKIPNRLTASDFRPIGLCNFAYNIISKILVNRLKALSPELKTPFQSTFVAGRRIQDSIVITYEMLHYLKTRRTCRGVPGRSKYALKIDIQKAYDRVDWTFHVRGMEREGLCEKWVGLIKACISKVTYQVNVNGKRTKVITPTRGLRQGDLLSPCMFIVMADVFSRLIEQQVGLGTVEGSIPKRGCP